ncbi:hypothetical protein ACF0H5_018246 [Mactra antiquata]
MCIAVTSEQVLIDTTKPAIGEIFVNGFENNAVSYARLDTEIHISWSNFTDVESGITNVYVGLYECSSCDTKHVSDANCFLMADNMVHDDHKTSFYELELSSDKVYYSVLNFKNGAGLTTRVQSSSILIDVNSPFSGEVKITDNWNSHRSYQSSTSQLHGLMAIANTMNDYICPTQTLYFPSQDRSFIPLSSAFSTDYVVVNTSGAFLGIGYSADLTNVLKSSVVSDTRPLQNGNYTFTIRSAVGEFTITTLSFVTNTIVVPFEINDKPIEEEFDMNRFENITGMEVQDNNSTENSNITTQMTSIPTRQPGAFVPINDTDNSNETNIELDEYGFGIHLLGYRTDGNKNWHNLFWARSKFTDVQRWFQLPFDPSTGDHSYTIQVKKKTEFLDPTLDLTLIIDDEEIISIANFKFYGDVKLAALTWNENDFLPPILDIYKPFYSDAVITSVYVPDEDDKLCRHGKGFYDGESSIKEIWVGVSDNNKDVGNIMPMQSYKTFCFPCIQPCENICKEPCADDHHTNGFELIDLHVDNLNLEVSDMDNICNNVTNDIKCNSTAYYLNVKTVNFAGEETVAFSNGIEIDNTPPECEYVKCLDPDYDKDQPTRHLGSNSSIGAYWNCSEDISIIESYTVKVLSQSDVIMESTNVGMKTKAHFTLPGGTFKDGHIYSVEVTAINSAGIYTSHNCSVLVKLFPPDVSKASASPLYTSSTSTSNDDEYDVPYWTSSQTNIGIQWEGGNSEIEYYEWKIGTSFDGHDMVPPIIVGKNESGSTAIVHGKVEFDGKKINKTVAEFKNLTGMDPDKIAELQRATDQEKSFFNMEPGRCVHQSLYGVGYSHLKSKIQGKSVCVKRINDVFINATHHKMIASKKEGTNKWTMSSDARPEIAVYGQLKKGGLTVGSLDSDDVNSDYGSAATIDYKPYISNPISTMAKTSRMLRNRIQKLCNVTFFVSPAPAIEYDLIGINITVRKECDDDGNFQPALMYWNNEKEQWIHIDEGCRPYAAAVMDVNVYTSEICKSSTQSTDREKRSTNTSSSLHRPLMLTLARIKRTFPNHPPKILTDNISTFEDATVDIVIQRTDPENDTVVFEIKEQPNHLNCSITENTGQLHCSPEEDYYGTDSIKIGIVETGLPPLEKALSDEKLINIIISPETDMTDRYFVSPNGTVYFDKRPIMVHTFTVEANRSSILHLGTILLADVDGDEKFTAIPDFKALVKSTYELTKHDTNDFDLENVTSKNYRSLQAQDIHFHYAPEYNGNMTLRMISNTTDGSFTPSVTLEMFVLLNPCVHGHCNHPLLGEAGCNDTKRSKSFDDYVCVCDAGFKGQWCETEIDECYGEPCALMFDCEDLIDAYRCNINIPKLMAILVCSFLAIGVTIFLVFKLLKRLKIYKPNKIGVSTEFLHNFNINKTFEMDRPTTSRGIELEVGSPPLSTEVINPTEEVKPSIEDVQSEEPKAKPEVNIEAVTSLTAAVGMILPPHHVAIGKKVAKKKESGKLSTNVEEKKFLKESIAPEESKASSKYERPDSQMTDINV